MFTVLEKVDDRWCPKVRKNGFWSMSMGKKSTQILFLVMFFMLIENDLKTNGHFWDYMKWKFASSPNGSVAEILVF